jgi:hypothetical protein
MFSKLLKLSFIIAIVMVLAACGSNLPVVPILPTRTLPVPPTSHPVSVVTPVATQTPLLEISPTSLPFLNSSPNMGLTSQIFSIAPLHCLC